MNKCVKAIRELCDTFLIVSKHTKTTSFEGRIAIGRVEEIATPVEQTAILVKASINRALRFARAEMPFATESGIAQSKQRL